MLYKIDLLTVVTNHLPALPAAGERLQQTEWDTIGSAVCLAAVAHKKTWHCGRGCSPDPCLALITIFQFCWRRGRRGAMSIVLLQNNLFYP